MAADILILKQKGNGKMKKRVAAILLTGVLVAVLTGCGKNAEGTVPVSLVTEKTSDTAEDEAAQPSSEESGADETAQPSSEESGADETVQPPSEESGADETAQPPTGEPETDGAAQPPVEEPGMEEAAQPPAEESGMDGAVQPPVEEPGMEEAAQPPVEEPGMEEAAQPPADILPEILEQIYAEFPEGAYVEIIVEESEPNGDRYTPEEAIAIYRSLMEAGGKIWDPSLKGNWDETLGLYPIEDWYNHMENYNGSSWGTGFIFLDKGMPEWAAGTDLESFAIGDGAGNPWTRYYLEVTGYDAECVYITAWH